MANCMGLLFQLARVALKLAALVLFLATAALLPVILTP